MKENDFQLEELENEAVKKSSNAKRFAAAAGLMAAGAGTTLAATAVADAVNHPADAQPESVDLQEIAEAGANQVPEAAAPQPAVSQEVVVETVHQPVAPQEDTRDIEFTTNTHYYDQNGNLVINEESGKIEGHDFKILDVDLDGKADMLMVDVDGDHEYSLDEMEILTPQDNVLMGHPTAKHYDVCINTDSTPEPDPWVDPTPDPWDVVDGGDISNDFRDEKTGEVYSDDYAENNENYVNNADVVDTMDNDLAYEETEIGDDFVGDDVFLS